MSKKKIRSITVIGRRWFQRTYGNTYHTAQIMIDGKTVQHTHKHYGYDSQFEETAAEWLEENGYIPKRERGKHGGRAPMWRYCQELKIVYEAIGIDVEREKDL